MALSPEKMNHLGGEISPILAIFFSGYISDFSLENIFSGKWRLIPVSRERNCTHTVQTPKSPHRHLKEIVGMVHRKKIRIAP